jgi:hypothetical protein
VTNNLRHCFACQNGLFVKIQKPKSYDYNKEGWVPYYCNLCGICSDIEEIVLEKNVYSKISYRFIRKIIKILCNRELNFDYSIKEQVCKELQNKEIFSHFDLVDLIHIELTSLNVNLSWGFILNTIYFKLDFNSYT